MRAAVAALVVVLGVAIPAAAEPPLVKVRARARVLLEEVTPGVDGVLVRGEVIDARLRSGIGGKPITIEVGRRGRVERLPLTADAHGRFEARLRLPQGRFAIRVLADEDERYGAAQPAETRVDLSEPIPRRWLLLPLAATAVLLLGAALVRLQPWRRRARRQAAPVRDRALATGLRPARPGPFGALRPRDDFGFSGRVFDVHAEAWVTGATVEALVRDRPVETAITAVADDDGRFAFDALAAGHHEITVRAPGYVTERFLVAVPHRGELRGVRVDVVPVRVRVIEVYRDVALGLLPDPDLLWVWTPRELLVRTPAGTSPSVTPAASLAGSPPAAPTTDAPLPALTRLVEDTYYSGRPADEERIDDARRLAEAVGAPAPRA